MKKSKYASDGLTTLRSYAKYRILNDMIEHVRRHALSQEYQILIVDKSTVKVFSSCCKFFDVYAAGLYQIESLEYKRKKFPHTDAIYFISPTSQSINFLLEDFKDDSDPKKPQYGGVHLCFTSHLNEEQLKLIAQRKHLAPRVLSFNEINLDFFLFNDNVFHFSKKNILPAFKLCDESEKGVEIPAIQTLLDELAHRLFTVCAIFMEFPYVQFQNESPLAKALANKVNNALKQFYQQSKNLKVREPRGTILIVDRGFDLISPAIHDFFYQTTVYEFQTVGEEGEVKLQDNRKTVYLNDQDDLWVRFRNKHIAEVHAQINQEVSQVAAESKKKIKGKSTEDMSLKDMAEVIRSMPKYEEMMKRYHIHMELINKGIIALGLTITGITDFTQKEIRKLISLEQQIITGVDHRGNKINNTNLVKEISQISKTLNEDDYLRLLMIFFACFDLIRKDKDTLLKFVSNEGHRLILQNMEFLDQDLAESKKFRRRRQEMSSDEFNDYARKQSQSDYEILRSEPRVCKLIRQIHDCTIDQKSFPYIDKPKTLKKAKETKKKGAASNLGSEFDRQDFLENPRIFVFVIGGLSHHEIVSIANLQDSINAQIIPGANEILNTKEYLEQLERLHKKETDMAFMKGDSSGNANLLDTLNIDEDETQSDTYAINF